MRVTAGCVVLTGAVFTLVKTNVHAAQWYQATWGVLRWPLDMVAAWWRHQPVPRAGLVQLVMDPSDLMVLPLLFWKGATTRDRSILALCSAVTLYGLILTQTRSSWLGLLLAAVFVGIVSYRRILAGLAVLLVAFLLLAPGTYQERMLSLIHI